MKNDFTKVINRNINPKLTKGNIVQETENVENDIIYKNDFSMIYDFLNLHPNNAKDDYDYIIQKIRLIDFTNSTNLRMRGRKIFEKIAEKIQKIEDFDKRVKDGDPKLVNELANIDDNFRIFSFASKYCHYHNLCIYKKDDYSIYDRILKKIIPKYIHVTQRYIESCAKELDYKRYNNILKTMINVYELGDMENIRNQLDHFLWYPNR